MKKRKNDFLKKKTSAQELIAVELFQCLERISKDIPEDGYAQYIIIGICSAMFRDMHGFQALKDQYEDILKTLRKKK